MGSGRGREQERMHVLICGGGVIGASIAYFLSCRGLKPTVIESTGLACAASGKSGGFLARDWCRLNAIDFVVVGPDAPPVTLPKRRNVHCHDCLQPELHPSADAALFERVRGGNERCRPECREWLRPARTAYLQVRRVEEPRVVRGTSVDAALQIPQLQ